MKIKFKLDLASLGDNDIDNYAQDKVDRTDGNPEFPLAQPTIGKLKTVLPNYIKLLGNKNRTASENEAKRKLRAEIQDLLSTLATYCALDADGDTTLFLTSGFDLWGTNKKENVFTKPEKFKVVLSDIAGQATASIESFPGNRGYSFAWTEEPLIDSSIWNVKPSPKKECTFTGLPSGKKIWMRAGAVSPDGVVYYSDPIARIIQ